MKNRKLIFLDINNVVYTDDKINDEAMKAFGGMREVAEIINTDDGSDLLMPTFDDTANEGKITAENTDVGTDDVAFGQTSMGAFMYTSGVYLLPVQLLQDSKYRAHIYRDEGPYRGSKKA